RGEGCPHDNRHDREHHDCVDAEDRVVDEVREPGSEQHGDRCKAEEDKGGLQLAPGRSADRQARRERSENRLAGRLRATAVGGHDFHESHLICRCWGTWPRRLLTTLMLAYPKVLVKAPI